jgi:PAS domain S-box-containing protein
MSEKDRTVNDSEKELDVLNREIQWLRRRAAQLEQVEAELESVLLDLSVHQERLRVQNQQLVIAQKKLEASHRRYVDLFDSAPVGYLTIDHEGFIREANLTVAGLLHYRRRELIGQHLSELVPRHLHSNLNRHWEEVRTNGKAVVQIELFPTKDHSFFAEMESISIYPLDQTAAGDIRIAVKDVTERRKVETELAGHRSRLEQMVQERTLELRTVNAKLRWEIADRKLTEGELQKQNEILQSVFDHIPVMICFYDSTGQFITVNREFERITGWTMEEVLKQNVMARFYPDETYRGQVWEYMMADDRSWRDFTFHLKDGRRLESSWAIVGLSDGTHIGIGIDITERKTADLALRKSEARYRGVVEDQTEMICRFTTDFKITFVNDAYCRFFGRSHDDLMGVNYFSLIPQGERVTIKRLLNELNAGTPTRVFEQKAEHPGGEECWQQWTARAIMDLDHDVVEYQAVGRDITARKEADEQIRLYQGKLRSLASELMAVRERERRRIAVDLHDGVAQALTLSKMKLVTLSRSDELTPNACATIQESVALIEQTLKDTRSLILDLRPPVLYEVGLGAAIEELLEDFEVKHGIQGVFEDDGRPKFLDEDARSTTFRAVRELMLNVIKHARASQMRVSLRRSENCVYVDVVDNGVGFDTRESPSTSSKHRHFGLFSVGEQVRYLGGNLVIDSKPGNGTRARLMVPLNVNDNQQ